MKTRNFVAKHDHNKGGAHKSNKDYDRTENKKSVSEDMQDELEPIPKQMKCMHCKELFELEELRPSGYCSPCLKEFHRMYNIYLRDKKGL